MLLALLAVPCSAQTFLSSRPPVVLDLTVPDAAYVVAVDDGEVELSAYVVRTLVGDVSLDVLVAAHLAAGAPRERVEIQGGCTQCGREDSIEVYGAESSHASTCGFVGRELVCAPAEPVRTS